MKENFHNEVYLFPDMVLYEQREQKERKPDKAVICLRNDLEGILNKKEKKGIISLVRKYYKKIIFVDTQKYYLISTGKRDEELDEFFDLISDASVLITDRLHGMVFGTISHIPCIVFSNYNWKISGVYEWLRPIKDVFFQGKDTQIDSILQSIQGYPSRNTEKTAEMTLEDIRNRFADLANLIRRAINGSFPMQ